MRRTVRRDTMTNVAWLAFAVGVLFGWLLLAQLAPIGK